MHYFDYTRVAEKARIPGDLLQRLREIMEREFPTDEMMSELHVLRACIAIRDGTVSLDDVLDAEAASPQSHQAGPCQPGPV